MEIIGNLWVKFDTEQVSPVFQKREFVLLVTEEPKYPQYIKFQLTQEKCCLMDRIAPGQPISVKFNLVGKKWTNTKGYFKGQTTYFNVLEAWKITSLSR